MHPLEDVGLFVVYGDYSCCNHSYAGFCVNISFCFSAAAVAAKSLQSCRTLCDPIDGSLPRSSVPGILQARILGWVAISFSLAETLFYILSMATHT